MFNDLSTTAIKYYSLYHFYRLLLLFVLLCFVGDTECEFCRLLLIRKADARQGPAHGVFPVLSPMHSRFRHNNLFVFFQ